MKDCLLCSLGVIDMELPRRVRGDELLQAGELSGICLRLGK